MRMLELHCHSSTNRLLPRSRRILPLLQKPAVASTFACAARMSRCPYTSAASWAPSFRSSSAAVAICSAAETSMAAV